MRPPTIRVDSPSGAGLEHRRLIARAVRRAFAAQGASGGEVSVTLLADEDMASLHGEYLGVAETTDVIAFALHDPGEDVLGDVYVGREQALRQAAELGVDPATELARLAVHGALHVLGHEHPAGRGREKSEMFRIQESVMEGLER